MTNQGEQLVFGGDHLTPDSKGYSFYKAVFLLAKRAKDTSIICTLWRGELESYTRRYCWWCQLVSNIYIEVSTLLTTHFDMSLLLSLICIGVSIAILEANSNSNMQNKCWLITTMSLPHLDTSAECHWQCHIIDHRLSIMYWFLGDINSKSFKEHSRSHQIMFQSVLSLSISLVQDQYQDLQESIWIGETTCSDRQVCAYQHFYISSRLVIFIHIHVCKSIIYLFYYII